jgi:hypothetical protein
MTRASYPGKEHPIGYVEVQSSWLDSEKSFDETREHIAELVGKTLKENPGLRRHGARIEFTTDGDGRRKANLYLGFAPRRVAAEPLNPRNMNNAPLPQPGAIEPTDGITPIGWKENQFGRGS